MSSQIVYKPKQGPHFCRPGWTKRTITEPGKFGPPVGSVVLVPPTPWNFPAGTVVECDCGKTYVSVGSPYRNAPGVCHFRREGWLARWWRELGYFRG